MGPDVDQLQEVKIPNRIVSWCQKTGIQYEADPRHIEIIIDQLGLHDAKPVSTPGTKEEGRTQADHEDRFGEKEISKYRAIVARCNYISPDRPDISYIVKEFARSMVNTRNGDWQRLKRLGRYIKGHPRLQQFFEWQKGPVQLKIYSDADWAGCRETRRSTTGGCVMLGKHTIKGWSKTQSLVALSSGESGLYATLKAAAEGLGITAMMSDMGVHVRGEVWGDANVALGVINRKGLGKTRHIDTGYLWIQDVVAKGRLKFHKILGKDNPADLYTKYLDERTNQHHTNNLAYKFRDGRAQEAPKLHFISRSKRNGRMEKILLSAKRSDTCWMS